MEDFSFYVRRVSVRSNLKNWNAYNLCIYCEIGYYINVMGSLLLLNAKLHRNRNGKRLRRAKPLNLLSSRETRHWLELSSTSKTIGLANLCQFFFSYIFLCKVIFFYIFVHHIFFYKQKIIQRAQGVLKSIYKRITVYFTHWKQIRRHDIRERPEYVCLLIFLVLMYKIYFKFNLYVRKFIFNLILIYTIILIYLPS